MERFPDFLQLPGLWLSLALGSRLLFGRAEHGADHLRLNKLLKVLLDGQAVSLGCVFADGNWVVPQNLGAHLALVFDLLNAGIVELGLVRGRILVVLGQRVRPKRGRVSDFEEADGTDEEAPTSRPVFEGGLIAVVLVPIKNVLVTGSVLDLDES